MGLDIYISHASEKRIPRDSFAICKSDAGIIDCLHRLCFPVSGRIIEVNVKDSEMPNKQNFSPFSATFFPVKEGKKRGYRMSSYLIKKPLHSQGGTSNSSGTFLVLCC